jgi:hypothetical protein
MPQRCETFKRVSKSNIGHAQAICSECSKIEEISDRNNMPPDQMQQKFVLRGWKMDGARGRDLCPDCVESRKSKGKVIQMKDVQPQKVELPRVMTRDHKRRINELLHDRYIGDDVGYAGSHTDESVAREINVPVAWVREIRVDLHGDNAGCEDDASAISDAREALAEGKRLEAETWAKLTTLSDRLGRIERALEVIKAKAS